MKPLPHGGEAGALRRYGRLRALRARQDLRAPARVVPMPEVSPSEQPDCGHDLPGHAQAAELVVSEARVISDGLASYNRRTLKDRAHAMTVQTKAEKAILRCPATSLGDLQPQALVAGDASRGDLSTSMRRPTSTNSPSVTTGARPRGSAGPSPGRSSLSPPRRPRPCASSSRGMLRIRRS